ncbi:uncharacterized protein LOC132052964 [Lycium ferocissimum]|uniref:uncharacterized protein LOC132052964 n=1 Tax=Lycium ferocissimum TaxID=112874 RepID=UPI002815FBDF|nr:uncharacterized protein LOC132052964 [Lycium ferocissimum]
MDIDTDISRWILEFILQQPLEDNILNTLIQILPFPNNNLNLKKALILRKIESEISNGCVTEKILEFLELIEELDHQEGIEASNVMKTAYCAVAVECTVKFLNCKEAGSDKGKYFEAVRRIWKKRINLMEKMENVGVVSDELWNWRDEIEAALWEDRCFDNVIRRSKCVFAVDKVKVFVGEVKERMGSPFLDVVAEKYRTDDTMKAFFGGVNDDREGRQGTGLPRQKHVAFKRTRRASAGTCGGVRISDSIESEPEASSRQDDLLPSPAIQKADDTLKAFVGGVNEEGTCRKRDKEVCQGKALPRQKHVAFKRTRGAVRISDSIESELEAYGRQDDLLSSPLIQLAEEALKLSSSELRAVVKDPLPDAIRLADTLSSVVRDDTGHQPAENNSDKAPHPVVASSRTVQASEKNCEAQHNCHHSAASRPNRVNRNSAAHTSEVTALKKLLASNRAAHTSEWDDLFDELNEGSPSGVNRVTLPSPKRTKISPLKKYEFKKITTRRKPTKWSTLEEDTLRTGVQMYGSGNWTVILGAYRDIFAVRTAVDLKDKWRNMIS